MFRTLGFPFEGKLSPKVTEEVSINRGVSRIHYEIRQYRS